MTGKNENTTAEQRQEDSFREQFRKAAESPPEELGWGGEIALHAFLLESDKSKDLPAIDDLKTFLTAILRDIRKDPGETRFMDIAPEFRDASMTKLSALRLPFAPLPPYPLWALIVAEYQDIMRVIAPERFARLSAIAAKPPDSASPLYYEPGLSQDEDRIDREMAVFGNHLVTMLEPYRRLRANLEKALPDLDIRPSVRLNGTMVRLAAYATYKPPRNGRNMIPALNWAASGREGLRIIG